MIFRISSSLYPIAISSFTRTGYLDTSSMPMGTMPLMPSKSDPSPTWSGPDQARDVIDVAEKFFHADARHVVVVAHLNAADPLPIGTRRFYLGVALGTILDVDLVRGGVEVACVKVDADHAILCGYRPDDLIRHVAGIARSISRGMRDEDRGAAGSTASRTALSEMCETSTIMPMRFIPADKFLASRRKAICAGAGPSWNRRRMLKVGQRHGPHSEPVKVAQDTDAVADQRTPSRLASAATLPALWMRATSALV